MPHLFVFPCLKSPESIFTLISTFPSFGRFQTNSPSHQSTRLQPCFPPKLLSRTYFLPRGFPISHRHANLQISYALNGQLESKAREKQTNPMCVFGGKKRTLKLAFWPIKIESRTSLRGWFGFREQVQQNAEAEYIFSGVGEKMLTFPTFNEQESGNGTNYRDFSFKAFQRAIIIACNFGILLE